MAKQERECRTYTGTVEVRANEDGERRGITGLAIPVDAEADIGTFTESISREAVEAALRQGDDVRALFNHSPDFLLAKTGSGTMRLRVEADGLHYDIDELPATRADVAEMIERGDLDGNSFSFTVAKDGEVWENRGVNGRAKPHRTITKFGKLFDVGPVVFPAYEGHTVVSARSLQMAEVASAEVDVATEGLDIESVTTTPAAVVEAVEEEAPEATEDAAPDESQPQPWEIIADLAKKVKLAQIE